MFANAAQVAAVIGARICAVIGSGRVSGLIVGGITIGEAVRHDEVNHIRLRKAVKLSGGWTARRQRQFKGGFSSGSGDAADGGA